MECATVVYQMHTPIIVRMFLQSVHFVDFVVVDFLLRYVPSFHHCVVKRNEENLREKNGETVLLIFIYITFVTFGIMGCLVYS